MLVIHAHDLGHLHDECAEDEETDQTQEDDKRRAHDPEKIARSE